MDGDRPKCPSDIMTDHGTEFMYLGQEDRWFCSACEKEEDAARMKRLEKECETLSAQTCHLLRMDDHAVATCDPRVDVERLTKDRDARKGDPVTRFHNLCAGLQTEMDESPYSAEEWDRILEDQRVTLKENRELRTELEQWKPNEEYEREDARISAEIDAMTEEELDAAVRVAGIDPAESERHLDATLKACKRMLEERDRADAAEDRLELLQEIAQRMEGQDNAITADPIFLVQQKRRIYGMDAGCGDGFVWRYDGEEVAEHQDDQKEFFRENEISEDEAVKSGFLVEAHYIDIWEFVQPFFSQGAADEYIEANEHNLTDPRVYVDSAYRNKEWQAVRAVLLGTEGD